MAPPAIEFEHGNVRVLGFSLAGEESYFVAPELNLGFDFGRCQRDVLGVDHIFLSHGHMDHAAGVAYYFSQRMFIDNEPGHVYVPRGLEGPIRRLLEVWGEIDGRVPESNVHVASPGEDVVLRRDLLVRPFEVNHPCRGHRGLGFTAIETRQKLIPEYQGLNSEQLVELKRQGVPITTPMEIPLLTYCGDTAPGDFFELDHVRESKVLLLECTFVEPDHLERARAGNHMHITDLRDVVPRLRNERIVLTHLSRRTAWLEAREMIRGQVGADEAERITFLMEHRRRGKRGGTRGGRKEPDT